MGTVYLARDQRSQSLVALKILAPKRAQEEERVLARFRREMDMCQRVSHSHLAWTHEVGVYHGVHYIAMEYIPGKSLHRLVSERGPLSVSRAARLFAEVANGLEHAHGQGLIHRDLKPSNIMVTPHDHAKLLDLGLALVLGEDMKEREVIGGKGYIVGTMDYISPEQVADASRVDSRSDVYGLGCTLYFALTGRPPFPEGTRREKLECHRSQEPEPLERLNPNLPAGFVALVQRMMAKNPADRFPSAAAVARELQTWTSGEQVQAMDRPEDTAYLEAVRNLETVESGADATPLEQLPRKAKPRGRPSRLALTNPARMPLSLAAWPLYVVFGILGLLAALMLAAVVVYLVLS